MINFTQKITLLLLLFLKLSINAQTLEKEFDKVSSKNFQPSQPGASILISKKGNIIYKKAFGLANVELEVPMKTDMVFEIGSLTKQFTAVAILQLSERGKLKLDDPITKYIPNYPTQGNIITIKNLLTHTSGIKNFTNMQEWSLNWRKDFTLEETIQLFKNQPLDFNPGEKFSYTNSGYVILGYIIEKASGLDYATYMEENLFKPSKMIHTQFGSHSKVIMNRANGYQKNDSLLNAEYLSFSQPHAAGALMSTVDDIFLWHNALKSNLLIKNESLQLALTNYKTNKGESINYGFGFMLNELYSSPTIEHGGGIFGFVTYTLFLPKEDVYIVVLTNCDNYNPESIAVELAAVTLNKKWATNQLKKTDETSAMQYVGSYKFDDNMTRIISYENNTLYTELVGGNKIALIPLSENEFALDGIIDARMKFEEKSGGFEAILLNRINVKRGIKLDMNLNNPKEILLSNDILKNYAGDYLIAPNLTFQVLVEENRLFLQFPHQPKVEAFATSESEFFTKLVDVKLQFSRDIPNNNLLLTIKQNGQTIVATKK